MKNIKLKLEYDGTNYCGWQKQKEFVTVQGTLEKSISEAIGETVEVIGVSRTDAGVHVREYICNFFTNSKIPSKKFKQVINAYLPSDIVVIDSEEVSSEFHSRYNSKGKTYLYTVLNREQPAAIGRNYFFHFEYEANIEKMKKASEYFIGTHDFSAFKTKGSSTKSSIRTITQLDIYKENDIIKFVISGDGFLYNMVRIIVGTLLEVGIGKRQPESIKSIIDSKDRTKAGRCVPGCGLCLYKVFY